MELSITKEDMKSYAEVNYIINHMNERYFDKIPQKIKDFLYIVKDDSYEASMSLNPAVPLTKQGISQYALEVIAIFHLKYWCENEEAKRSLLTRIEENHRKFEEQLRSKYSSDVFGEVPTSSSNNIYQGLQNFENNIAGVNVKSIQDIKANKETNYEEIEKAAEMAESQKAQEASVQDLNISSAKNVEKEAEQLTEISKNSSFTSFLKDLIDKIKFFFGKTKEKMQNKKETQKVEVKQEENVVDTAPVNNTTVTENVDENIKEEVSSK